MNLAAAGHPSLAARFHPHEEGSDAVYHVTIVASGHGLLKKFWPLVIGCVLRTAGRSFMWNYADPLTSLELLNYYITLAMSSGRFAYYIIQRNDTTNDSIFHMSGG